MSTVYVCAISDLPAIQLSQSSPFNTGWVRLSVNPIWLPQLGYFQFSWIIKTFEAKTIADLCPQYS